MFLHIKQTGFIEEEFETESGDVDENDNTFDSLDVESKGYYITKEFLDFYEFAPNITVDEKFQRYLQFGGMPILREYKFNEARSNLRISNYF